MFRRHSLTLCLEGTTIRLVSFRGLQVDQWSEIELPSQMVVQGVVTDPEAVGAMLANRLEAERLPTRRVISGIPGHRSIFRTLTFPPLEQSLIEAAVDRKIRQEIPLPDGEMDFTWTQLNSSDKELLVFVVATPRPVVDSLIHTLHAAGLQPRAVDVNPLALVRTANERNGLIADLEAHALSVVIIQDGVPAIVRTVPLNPDSTSPEAGVELLIQEIGRTTKFFNESHRQARLPDNSALVATGTAFESAALLNRVAESFTYQVRRPHPPLQAPPDFQFSRYAINLGLGLKSI